MKDRKGLHSRVFKLSVFVVFEVTDSSTVLVTLKTSNFYETHAHAFKSNLSLTSSSLYRSLARVVFPIPPMPTIAITPILLLLAPTSSDTTYSLSFFLSSSLP
ncbi:hypothetical protein AAHE18_20G257100 [Arachis hypogaea]